jgi:hypothetical protein
MNIWSIICDALSLTPAQEAEYHQLELEYGVVEPTSAEQRIMDTEDANAYMEHAPIERDVWYDDLYGHWTIYKTDQQGHRHILDSGTFYAGYTGEVKQEIVPVVMGEVVDETLLPVYMRMQG